MLSTYVLRGYTLYFRFLKISLQRFHHLLTLVKEAIPQAERLAIALRFLASGESQQSLAFLLRVGR